jgi:phosphoribosyl-ATP pyrophosphohydrolase
MMDRQAELQRTLSGSDPRTRSPEEQMEYLREMFVALVSELNEAMDETGWKTWATSNHINRDAFLSEMVDLLQFWMNMVALTGATASEIRNKLERKHFINYRRLTEGYDGLNKCPVCMRALDDEHVMCTPQRCALKSDAPVVGAHT